MNVEEIKSAVQSGKRVCWHNAAYEVICDKLGQWFIRCTLNGSCIGLTWRDEKTLNGKPEQFFVHEAAVVNEVYYLFETRVAGISAPMADFYYGKTIGEAVAAWDENCHRYGLPMDKVTVTIRRATEEERRAS